MSGGLTLLVRRFLLNKKNSAERRFLNALNLWETKLSVSCPEFLYTESLVSHRQKVNRKYGQIILNKRIENSIFEILNMFNEVDLNDNLEGVEKLLKYILARKKALNKAKNKKKRDFKN